MRALRPARSPGDGAAFGAAGRATTATVRDGGISGPADGRDAGPARALGFGLPGRVACPSALGAEPGRPDAGGGSAGRGEPSGRGTVAATGAATGRSGAPVGAAVATAMR